MRLFVNLATGPENPTRAAPAFVPVAHSGKSSQTRGINGESRPGVQLAQPARLLELAEWAEKTLVY